MAIDAASPSFENCIFTGNHRNLFVTGISKPTFTNCSFRPSTILNGDAYNLAIDMNANVDFTTDSIKFNNKKIRAVRILPSTVIDDARLKKLSFINLDNPTYCLYETTTIHDTASLVIDPGVVIKCRQYNSMITANGTLTGIGTEAEPIIFTHLADDNFGNPLDSQNDGVQSISNSNSGRIAIYGTATSKIKNWKIHYGGSNSGNWAVYVTKGNIVENCEIKSSYRGIYFYDNAQVLSNSFVNINYFPVGRKVNLGNPVLLGNTVSNVGYIGILIGEFGTDSPTLKSMDFAGLTNVAYIIESQLSIPTGSVVSVDPGVVIKFNQRYYGYLTVNGAIKAIGKASNKIIFTSISDDSAAGDTNNNGTASTPTSYDWQGLDFTGTASDTENILKNCEIRYCGYPSYWDGAIRFTDCQVVMDSTKVNFTYSHALCIFGNANPEITNCELYNLGNAPIYMDMFSNPTFSGNKVANLPRIGLRTSVTINITQKVVMTREAFEGTLTIFNGNTTTAMQEIKLDLEIKDENGVLCNDLFQIETKALDILTGIDGTGSLGAEEKGSATILFIPEKGAAPEVPKSYSFGGSFSYLDPFTGVTVTKPLFPVTLDVNPSPDLYLHYFMQRDILGDDALTVPIEPIVPAEFAVMVQNNGFGVAKNVRIESAQPKIVENEKGLAINFALIGSNLNGQPTQLGLTNINFGNIPAKKSTIGQWWFTSDLLGHFISYETKLTHLDSRGNSDLSLISGVSLHELIRSVRVYSGVEDNINDFLVNEVQDAKEFPDVIYLSNGGILDVYPAVSQSTSGNIAAANHEIELLVTPVQVG